MKNLLGFLLFILAVSLFAAPPSEVDLVKERAALNSAKADLEEARKKRDMAVAARWKDREAANQERELFNEKYKENKEKVEALMLERARLQEDVRVGREDLSQMRAAMETARAEFLALTAGPERLTALQQIGEQGVPFKMPERLECFNKLKKEMELYRDDPMRIAKGIFEIAEAELRFSRSMEREEAELVFGSTVANGSRLRLGGLYAMQAANQGPAAIMLAQVGSKKRTFAWQENLTPEVKAQVEKALAKNDSQKVLVPVDVLLSTALSSEIANYAEKDFMDEAKEFFHNGGILMYPIAALLILGLLIALERLIFILLKGRSGTSAKVLKALKEGDLNKAKELSKGVKGSVGCVLSSILSKEFKTRENAEKILEEVFAKETPALEKGLSSISVMATTAPLLGLLGTVMGMIQLFEVITLHGTSDPKLLAGGISVALVTTEAGLMVAIPLQLLHTFLSNRVDRLVAKMENTGLALLNAVFHGK
jgi:biopolymer transport protein ExbB